MTSLDLIRRLHEHRRWANGRALAACRALTAEQLQQRFAIGQGSVLATLAHLYAAEYVWLAALEGDPNPPAPSEFRFEGVEPLEWAWRSLDARWSAFLSRLTENDLLRPVRKRSTSSGACRTFSTPAADVLLHVCTHAQYTLAQLANMLRQLGVVQLPDVMLITLSREEATTRAADEAR
jgi:uncharacterized damage-inducible protein DinB